MFYSIWLSYINYLYLTQRNLANIWIKCCLPIFHSFSILIINAKKHYRILPNKLTARSPIPLHLTNNPLKIFFSRLITIISAISYSNDPISFSHEIFKYPVINMKQYYDLRCYISGRLSETIDLIVSSKCSCQASLISIKTVYNIWYL